MIEALNNYDWGEVFGCAGEGGHYNDEQPQPVQGYTGSCAKFTREDVEIILAMDDGEPDSLSWMGAFQLKDGRYAFIEGGCDYTGWDCQSGGSSWVASDFEQLWQFGLTEEARNRLGDALICYLAKI